MNTLHALAFAVWPLAVGSAALVALAEVPRLMLRLDDRHRSRLRYRITSSAAPGRRS